MSLWKEPPMAQERAERGSALPVVPHGSTGLNPAVKLHLSSQPSCGHAPNLYASVPPLFCFSSTSSLLQFPRALIALVFTQLLEGKPVAVYRSLLHFALCIAETLWKGEGASKYLPHRSRRLKRILLSLPQPKCSLKSEHCGFKAIVPDPHHTHIFVLASHSQCQGVTSTIVSGTRWSLRRRKKKGGEGAGGGQGWGGQSTNPAVFQEDESLPRTSSAMLYLLPLRWYEAQLPRPSAASPGSASSPAAPLITGGRWGVHGERESCPPVAFSCLQFNEITLCEDLFYERLVYL